MRYFFSNADEKSFRSSTLQYKLKSYLAEMHGSKYSLPPTLPPSFPHHAPSSQCCNLSIDSMFSNIANLSFPSPCHTPKTPPHVPCSLIWLKKPMLRQFICLPLIHSLFHMSCELWLLNMKPCIKYILGILHERILYILSLNFTKYLWSVVNP